MDRSFFERLNALRGLLAIVHGEDDEVSQRVGVHANEWLVRRRRQEREAALRKVAP